MGDIPETGSQSVAATKTAFSIIEAVEEQGGAGVTALATELGIAKGTVHKHLSTLREIDYVYKRDGTYYLSIGFLGLGVAARSKVEIATIVDQPLQKLADTTNETANLLVPEHGSGVYAKQVIPDDTETPPIHEGKRVPLHATAGGKAILAYLDTETRERIFDHRGLEQLTENTITNREKLHTELQTVHDRRMAHAHGEHDAGWHCIARPITNTNQEPVAAVTITGPADRIREKVSNSDIPSFVASTTDSIQSHYQTRIEAP